ncbi:hypothetical protein FIBSPDRAFT_1039150 [Athelia psychrophila]|uniref:Uncharacterized protein n=1 Tax=Athelia psychrophila TaxID=1759441 RepID=A0A166S9E4_9AGAM|nr:hypothetical protein FIBSPDRAFT_1039150 [Fibularhizoctonia sp. CBS 109695]
MAHFATPLVNINLNTIDIVVAPCQFSPSPTRTHPSASIPRKRMHRRPRILSFPAAVVAFCKSLRLPSATNRYPQHAARRTLVASPIQVKAADLEVDDSVFVHKEHSDTVDHEGSLDADVASSSSSSELQARSKSPLSMISSPILEHWDSAELEHSSCAKIATCFLSEGEESIYVLDEDERHSLAYSVTSGAPSPPLPRTLSASLESEIGFLPLSPPPSHFRARRENAWRYVETNVDPEQSKDEQGYWPSDRQSVCQQH